MPISERTARVALLSMALAIFVRPDLPNTYYLKATGSPRTLIL